MAKTNYKQLTNPPYMGAYSMDTGEDSYFEIPAVLKSIKTEMVADPTGKQKSCLIGFTNLHKPFIINAGAQKVLMQISKSRYAEDWTGASIIFYVQQGVRNPSGGTIDALRIKAGAPTVIVDYSKQISALEGCKSLQELQAAFTSLTPAEQAAVNRTKDKMKAKLGVV